MDIVDVVVTATFKKQVNKLHKNQKRDLDKAVLIIRTNPGVGEVRKGDLKDIQVYKFRIVNELILLAYTFHEDQLQLILLTFGSHENFYRDLKKTS